jgi:hypothetical protein
MRQATKLLGLARNGWDDAWLMENYRSNTLGLKAIDSLRTAIKQAKDRGHPDRGQIRSK